jgi:predicted Zn-dependent protease
MKTRGDWLVLLVLVAVFVPAMHFAWRLFDTNWLALQPRLNMVKWGAEQAPMDVREWVESRNRMQRALAVAPNNPMLHDLLASLYLLRARQSLPGTAFANNMYNEALLHQRASLALRPGHGWAWAGLAESLLALDAANPEGWQAWQRARQFAPHEMFVTTTLYFAAKRAGSQAPAHVQQWMRDTETNAPPRLRKWLGLP